MSRITIATIILGLAALPAAAQTPQQPIQQQLDGAAGQINRIVGSMSSLIVQQDAQIKDLQAELATAKATAPAPAVMVPSPKPSDKQ